MTHTGDRYNVNRRVRADPRSAVRKATGPVADNEVAVKLNSLYGIGGDVDRTGEAVHWTLKFRPIKHTCSYCIDE